MINPVKTVRRSCDRCDGVSRSNPPLFSRSTRGINSRGLALISFHRRLVERERLRTESYRRKGKRNSGWFLDEYPVQLKQKRKKQIVIQSGKKRSSSYLEIC